MLSAGFEPTISAGVRPQTYALDRAATGTGSIILLRDFNEIVCIRCFELWWFNYIEDGVI